MNQLNTICITGATGCVGRNILDKLIQLPSHPQITIIHRENSKLERLHNVQYDRLKFSCVNLMDYSSFLSAIPQAADVLIHAAGNTSYNKNDQEQQYDDNVLLTRNLLNASLFNGVEKFIHTSTAAVNSSISSWYVQTKQQAEREVWLAYNKGLNTTILQPAIVIGKYDYNSYYHIFKGIHDRTIKKAFPGSMEFCSAERVADAHINAINTKAGTRFILGGYYAKWSLLFHLIHWNLHTEVKTYKPYNKKWLKFLSWLESFRRNPRITPKLVDLMLSGQELPEPERIYSQNELNYKTDMLGFLRSIRIYSEWLKQEDLL